MSNQTLLEIFKKYLEVEKINEATTSGIARGSYKAPVRPGLTYWDLEDLQPYVSPVSKYVNAESNYDSLDGHMSTSKKEIDKKEKEIITEKLNQEHRIEIAKLKKKEEDMISTIERPNMISIDS